MLYSIGVPPPVTPTTYFVDMIVFNGTATNAPVEF